VDLSHGPEISIKTSQIAIEIWEIQVAISEDQVMPVYALQEIDLRCVPLLTATAAKQNQRGTI